MGDSHGIRFVDVLTTGSAVANYLGVADVTPSHLISAISVLRGDSTLEDLGRPLSPLLRRGQPGSHPAVRDLAQRWFVALGSDTQAELSGTQLADLLAELRTIVAAEPAEPTGQAESNR
jgi:hypothetical protein